MKKNLNKKSGFSMLELVVVMLIMGTLAGIAISKMGGSDTGALKASVKRDIRNAIASINSCYADRLDYASCIPARIATAGGTGNVGTGSTYTINLSPNNTLALSGTTGTGSTFPGISITGASSIGSANSIVYDPDNTTTPNNTTTVFE